MSIASEITRINNNIASAYTACNGKGATMPATQNSANLATCIGSIQTGSTPTLITKNITANGTYNASSDNADGYSSVTVNVSGGGGTGVTVNGVATKYNYLIKKSGNTLTFENIQYWDGDTDYYDMLGNETEIIDLISDNYVDNTEIVNVIFGAIESIDYTSAFHNAFEGATNLTYVYLGGLSGEVSITRAFQNTFIGCTSLVYVDFNNIEYIGQYFFQNAFEGCTSLETVGLNKLYAINSQCFSYAFKNSSISTLSFPALNSQSFGRYTNQFNNMLKGVTGCTVHFPSNLQSIIGSWSSVTSGFGGTNTTVLFDLPATT